MFEHIKILLNEFDTSRKQIHPFVVHVAIKLNIILIQKKFQLILHKIYPVAPLPIQTIWVVYNSRKMFHH